MWIVFYEDEGWWVGFDGPVYREKVILRDGTDRGLAKALNWCHYLNGGEAGGRLKARVKQDDEGETHIVLGSGKKKKRALKGKEATK